MTRPPDDTIGFDNTLRGLAPGQRLAGRFELIRELGRGGMGVVWLARDLELRGDEVALKVLPEALARDEDAVDRLVEEARVAMRLAHAGIMRLHNLDRTEQGLPFLVMEYLPGINLKELFRARRKARASKEEPLLSEVELIGLVEHLAPALDCAHAERVIHQDLKPANLMLAAPVDDLLIEIDFDSMPVKICDFGIARVLEDTRTHLTGMPTAGTLAYMSPEQVRGQGIGPVSDLYSLGCVLYEAITGLPPFVTGDLAYQHVNVEARPLTGPFLEVSTCIHKCIEKDPQKRFSSAGDLARDLLIAIRPNGSPKQHLVTRKISSEHRQDPVGKARWKSDSNRKANDGHSQSSSRDTAGERSMLEPAPFPIFTILGLFAFLTILSFIFREGGLEATYNNAMDFWGKRFIGGRSEQAASVQLPQNNQRTASEPGSSSTGKAASRNESRKYSEADKQSDKIMATVPSNGARSPLPEPSKTIRRRVLASARGSSGGSDYSTWCHGLRQTFVNSSPERMLVAEISLKVSGRRGRGSSSENARVRIHSDALPLTDSNLLSVGYISTSQITPASDGEWIIVDMEPFVLMPGKRYCIRLSNGVHEYPRYDLVWHKGVGDIYRSGKAERFTCSRSQWHSSGGDFQFHIEGQSVVD